VHQADEQKQHGDRHQARMPSAAQFEYGEQQNYNWRMLGQIAVRPARADQFVVAAGITKSRFRPNPLPYCVDGRD
jgi:hypothetical protein